MVLTEAVKDGEATWWSECPADVESFVVSLLMVPPCHAVRLSCPHPYLAVWSEVDDETLEEADVLTPGMTSYVVA